MADKTQKEDSFNDRIDDIPQFLLRSGKDVTPKFIHKVVEASNSPVQTREPLQAVIVLPDKTKAVAPPRTRSESSMWDSLRTDGFTEEVYRTTQWDSVLERSVTVVQFRRWDANAQLWFEYERMLAPGETGREKIPLEDTPGSLVRGIYFEGWEAFDGEKFLKLGFNDLMELCPYGKGSINSVEWWEGFFNGAKAFWISFNKEMEEMKKPDEVYVC